MKICTRCGKPFFNASKNAKYCHNPCRQKIKVQPQDDEEKKPVWTSEMIERWETAMQEPEGIKRLANLITKSEIKIEIRKRIKARVRELRRIRCRMKSGQGGAA